MATAKCKSCGAEIVWGTSWARGIKTAIPLDAVPEKRFVLSPGFDDVSLQDTYQTHFVTCPDAKEHRKAK